MADQKNHVRKLREAQLISKAELARKAGLSPLTIDRVEAGKPSRMDTRRKIILALGYKLSDRYKVFPEEGAESEAEPAGTQEQLSFDEKVEEESAGGRGRGPRRRRSDVAPIEGDESEVVSAPEESSVSGASEADVVGDGSPER